MQSKTIIKRIKTIHDLNHSVQAGWFSRQGMRSLASYFSCMLLLLISSMLFAQQNSSDRHLSGYLRQENSGLKTAMMDLDKKSEKTLNEGIQERLKQNDLMISLITVKIQSFEDFLENQDKKQKILADREKAIKKTYVSEDAVEKKKARLAQIASQQILIQENKALLKENITLAKKYKEALLNEKNQLEAATSSQKLREELKAIKKAESQINTKLNQLYQQNVELHQQEDKDIDSQSINTELQLLINNQWISLKQQSLNILNYKQKILRVDDYYLKNKNSKSLKYIINSYKDAISHFQSVRDSLNNILVVIDKETTNFQSQSLMLQWQALHEETEKNRLEVEKMMRELISILSNYQGELTTSLSARQSFSEYKESGALGILKEFLTIPGLLFKYVQSIALKTFSAYQWLNFTQLLSLGSTIFLLFLMRWFLNAYLLRFIEGKKAADRLSGYLFEGSLVLIQKNLWQMSFLLMLIAIFQSTGISSNSYRLLMNLLVIWLAFRAMIFIARRALLERVSDSSGKDVKLYYRLKWLLIFGGFASAFMYISHLLPLSSLMQDIFNRLFMGFILAVSMVSWRSRDALNHVMRPFLKKTKRYFRNMIKLLILLLPLTLFSTAVIGLSGYIYLAWIMSRYQACVLLILILYIFLRGLLIDTLEILSEWMISSLQNGWLWVEVFLKPLDKILRVFVLALSFFLLIQTLGFWDTESKVADIINFLLHYPLINLSGLHITLLSTFEFVVVLMIFIWAAKWSREFAYRWLFKQAKDAGIRNSLSAFLQYTVILIGGFITLRVLGLDFSGMSFVIGGLAVGMGFGLRDFASNIIGGIMLLIERPVREGDLITIGNYEGRVAHIGIRSMRVSSWDNMEVLIPNAETFNKPFTNWTHQDFIVRTVIPVKVCRSDDPVVVRQLLLDVLAIIPEILDDPPPQVFLKKIDEALIEYEVRYFISIEKHTRFEVRSEVLFAIIAQFKAAGIKAPIEPYSIEIAERNNAYFFEQLPPEK